MFDEIIAVERLEEGIIGLNRRFGQDVKLPKANVQRYQGRREPAADRAPKWLRKHGTPPLEFFYDDETRALAMAAYAEDIAFYRRQSALLPEAGC